MGNRSLPSQKVGLIIGGLRPLKLGDGEDGDACEDGDGGDSCWCLRLGARLLLGCRWSRRAAGKYLPFAVVTAPGAAFKSQSNWPNDF